MILGHEIHKLLILSPPLQPAGSVGNVTSHWQAGILKLRLKLAAGYFQFGSDYLGEGEWQGNSLLPVV